VTAGLAAGEPPPRGRGLLQRLALLARRRYGRVFAALLVLVAVSLALASRLRFDTDVLHLLPHKDPVVQAYLETLAEFGTFDYLMVAVEIPEGAPADPYETYVDALAKRLGALPQFETVEHRTGDVAELLEEFFPEAFLFLDEAGRRELTARLGDDAVRQRVREVRRLLTTPQSLVLKDLLRLDPLGIASIFVDRLASGQGSLAMDWASGYYLSNDQRLLLILAKPRHPPQDIGFDEAMVAAADEAIAATGAEWGEIAGPEAPPPPTARLGGAYVTAMEDAHLIQGDMVVNMASSMALVLLLFLFAFRRAGTLVYAFLPLVVGLVLTFGFSAVAFGVLSSATSGTAALLIGLGIDFVIVSYGRFVEERQRGRGLEGALEAMMGSSGRAVVVGAVTTAATFYAFTFTDFRGLRQMGLLTGTGILFCMAAVLWLLPAMLAWSEDHHRRRDRQPNLYLHSFGTDRLVRLSMHRPWPVLAVGLAITAAAGVLTCGLTFQDNWRAMRPAGNRGVEVEAEVSRHFKSDFDFMMLVLSGNDLDQLLERTDEATRRAQQLVADGVLTGVNSVTSVVPPPGRQQEALAWLAAGRRDGALDPGRIRATFDAEARAEGLSPAYFDRGLDLLDQALSASHPLRLADLPKGGQARRLIDRVILKRGDTWKSVIYLYPPAEVWRRTAPPEAQALAAELGPGAILTGANVINENMRQRIRTDAWIAALLGTVVVFLLLWLDFRRLSAALFALTPLGVGILWMLGGMVALGISMNFMNIFVTTMIIGIGVDYGLHMVHRYREVRNTPGADLEAGLVETGNALLIAALSTVAGFGSLSLSHYPGLRSTGYVAILGALATCVVAVTLLPAYLSLRVKRRQRRES
jgi:uncharacterized protein